VAKCAACNQTVHVSKETCWQSFLPPFVLCRACFHRYAEVRRLEARS
jgi:hypothetical protein